MNRRRVTFYIVLALVAVLALFALANVVLNVINLTDSGSDEPDAATLQKGFEQVAPTSTQDDVIALMGSHEDVQECPQAPLTDSGGSICAHIYHYHAGDQSWDFQFDMNGMLMKKSIGGLNR